MDRTDSVSHPRKRASRGFSLLETVTAILVLSTGLLVLAQLVGIAITTNAKARSSSVAVAVAQGRMESLRALYYQEIHTGISSPDLTAGEHVDQPINVGSRSFKVRYNVTTSSGNRKMIRLTAFEALSSGSVTTGYTDAENTSQTRSVTVISEFAP